MPVVLAVLVVLAASAGCTKPSVPAAQPSAGPLVLGTLLPVTGGFAHVGPSEEAGLQLAIKDIDAAGGVLGQPVTLIDSDSGDAFSAVASQSVDRMLARKVDAIVGGTGSSVTLSVIDKVVGAGVALVSPGDASAKLDGYPDRGLYARLVPPDSFEASTLGAVLKGAGHRSVAVLFERDTYATGYAADLQADVQRDGGRVVAAIEYDGRSTDFSAAAAQVAAAAPQAVVVIGTGEAHALLQALVAAGTGPQVAPLYVSDLALWPGLVSGLTALQAAGVTGVRPGAAPAAAFLGRLAQQAPRPRRPRLRGADVRRHGPGRARRVRGRQPGGQGHRGGPPGADQRGDRLQRVQGVPGPAAGRWDDRVRRAGREGQAGRPGGAGRRCRGDLPVRAGRYLPPGRQLCHRHVPTAARLRSGRARRSGRTATPADPASVPRTASAQAPGWVGSGVSEALPGPHHIEAMGARARGILRTSSAL